MMHEKLDMICLEKIEIRHYHEPELSKMERVSWIN